MFGIILHCILIRVNPDSLKDKVLAIILIKLLIFC